MTVGPPSWSGSPDCTFTNSSCRITLMVGWAAISSSTESPALISPRASPRRIGSSLCRYSWSFSWVSRTVRQSLQLRYVTLPSVRPITPSEMSAQRDTRCRRGLMSTCSGLLPLHHLELNLVGDECLLPGGGEPD